MFMSWSQSGTNKKGCLFMIKKILLLLVAVLFLSVSSVCSASFIDSNPDRWEWSCSNKEADFFIDKSKIQHNNDYAVFWYVICQPAKNKDFLIKTKFFIKDDTYADMYMAVYENDKLLDSFSLPFKIESTLPATPFEEICNDVLHLISKGYGTKI